MLMRLLLEYDNTITVNIALAREIGLNESLMLLELYKAISKTGTMKDSLKSVARTDKELKAMFNWCKTITEIREGLRNLQSKKLINISENSLFDDASLWYSLNERELRKLQSITILSKEETLEQHIEQAKIPDKSLRSNEKPIIHQVLFGAFLKTCHWDKSISLTDRDKFEIGTSVKQLIARYPKNEIESLKLMVLGFDRYRIEILKSPMPYRPSGILRVWGDYATWCNKFNNGVPPKPMTE